MLLRERALYHQIHPSKLAVDILSEPVSLYFLWRHALGLGLLTHFAPPILASAVLMSFGNLERQKSSRLGHYVAEHMTRRVEAARLSGDIVMVFGAWCQSPGVIAAGLCIVGVAWLSGLIGARA